MIIVIDHVPIEVRRTQAKTTLLIQGRPYGLEMTIASLDELKRLALFFANEVGLWSDDELAAEDARAQTLSNPP